MKSFTGTPLVRAGLAFVCVAVVSARLGSNSAPDVSSNSSAVSCFDKTSTLCWSHAYDATDDIVSFTAVCKPRKGLAPGWCAFGLPVQGNSGGSMGPSQVAWLSRLSTGDFAFEDRVNLGGHFPPTCLVAQLSTATGYIGTDGSIHASWTRKGAVNEKYYLDISSGTSVIGIAAWGNRTGSQSAGCGLAGSGGWSQHAVTGAMGVTF